MLLKMNKKTSIRFQCPGCERKNFRSLKGVRNHFQEKRHSLQCPICEKTFKDELAVIQHYQNYYTKSKSASLGRSNDVPQIPSSSILPSAVVTPVVQSIPAHRDAPQEPPIPSPSVLPSAVVTPVVQSIPAHRYVPEEPPITSEQELEIRGAQLLHDLLASMPALNITNGPILEVLPGVASGTTVQPDIHLLEQNLILRYLRSRCHSQNRLEREGYIIGPTTVRNKKRPRKGSIPTYQFRETPRVGLKPAIHAIAIDCEMVGVKHGRQTLVFLSAINFLTGEVLISRYVNPSEKVLDWRYEFSGVTQTIMTSAVASGAAFKNWREARDRLWEFMDDSTVLVGHSLYYDLEVLGMSHTKIVDSAILVAESVFPSIPSTRPLTRQWGLKTLAKDFLGLDIQKSDRGHNALEDAYATRNVVIWCIRNPEDLKVWAEKARLQEEQKRQRNGKSKSKGKFRAQYSPNWEDDTSLDDEPDIRLSDLAEDLDWPEGYDPWSD